MIMSVLTFMKIHDLNDSYVVMAMFIVAGIFRLLMNLSVYAKSFAIAFVIGAHQSNNNLAWISQNGFSKFLEMMFTNFYGYLFIGIFVGLHFIVLTNLDKVVKEFKTVWRAN